MENKINVIRCPHCGTEYHPSEIFIPEYLIGRPKDIEKNYLGKIVNIEMALKPDLKEEFTCEKCFQKLNISAHIRYDVSIKTYEDYTTKKYKDRLVLNEE